MSRHNRLNFFFFTTGIVMVIVSIGVVVPSIIGKDGEFSGKRAFRDLKYQVSLGPRIPGSQAHEQVVTWIKSELEDAGWSVGIQEAKVNQVEIKNIIATRNDPGQEIILGAHYDSRLVADQDDGPESKPVPGANDGASGVAVLLELARTIPQDSYPVSLVFFDAEDNGNIQGRDWIMGSRYFVENLDHKPKAAIIVDMVGDAYLDIYIELNSDKDLVEEIWSLAGELGYEEQFIPTGKYSILDDHIPFLEAGIPAVDIIDFDYPYWHTTEDTIDKISSKSLEIVGDTLLNWLIKQ